MSDFDMNEPHAYSFKGNEADQAMFELLLTVYGELRALQQEVARLEGHLGFGRPEETDIRMQKYAAEMAMRKLDQLKDHLNDAQPPQE